MTGATAELDALRARQPEWTPWLSVLAVLLTEIAGGRWRSAVPEAPPAQPAVPLLAGTAIQIERRTARRLLRRLVRGAASSGSPTLATLAPLLRADVDALAMFEASLCQDKGRLDEIAAALQVDAEALQAIVALFAVPFLHACRQRWATHVPESWVEGYCPICGSWPAFAEMRGIERSRHFRCGRCGSEWHARLLQCPYCAEADHEALASLVPERDVGAAIDACTRCGGYVKAFTRLQGGPADTVMLEDLGSVHLDVAAVQLGYRRPARPGVRPGVSIEEAAAASLFRWKA